MVLTLVDLIEHLIGKIKNAIQFLALSILHPVLTKITCLGNQFSSVSIFQEKEHNLSSRTLGHVSTRPDQVSNTYLIF